MRSCSRLLWNQWEAILLCTWKTNRQHQQLRAVTRHIMVYQILNWERFKGRKSERLIRRKKTINPQLISALRLHRLPIESTINIQDQINCTKTYLESGQLVELLRTIQWLSEDQPTTEQNSDTRNFNSAHLGQVS